MRVQKLYSSNSFKSQRITPKPQIATRNIHFASRNAYSLRNTSVTTEWRNTKLQKSSSALGHAFFREYSKQAIQLKPGDIIERRNKIFEVVKTDYQSKQQRGGIVQLELRDVLKGVKSMDRLQSGDKVEICETESSQYKFVRESEDGEKLIFQNLDTMEETELDKSFVGITNAAYLQEDDEVIIKTLDEKPLSIRLPMYAELEVESVMPISDSKEATLSNGRTVKVPSYIEPGDVIRVKIEDETFSTRVKK